MGSPLRSGILHAIYGTRKEELCVLEDIFTKRTGYSYKNERFYGTSVFVIFQVDGESTLLEEINEQKSFGEEVRNIIAYITIYIIIIL